jgi:RNA polymerase sigma-70 factor (ECF subfamily)
MLTDTASLGFVESVLQTPRVRAPAHRSGAGGQERCAPRAQTEKAMTATTTGGRDTDWADAMLRVRNARDEAAFADLFRHYAPRVKAFLMKSGASAAQAEDCMQDVMATVWNKAHLYDPARASVATWVFTIARNRRIDAIRRARRPEPEDLPWGPEAEPSQVDALVLQQESRRLGAALAVLPQAQRALIERAFYGDLSHSEIAAETGLPLGTIKSRIRLALDRLRHDMKLS